MAETQQSFTLEDVNIEMGGNIVGSASKVDVKMTQENKVIHANGNKKPREIMAGQIGYTGTVERLFLDKETITDLVDINNGDSPYFNLVGVTKNKNPERKVTIIDAKFKGFDLSMGLTDETKVVQEFDALDLDVS